MHPAEASRRRDQAAAASSLLVPRFFYRPPPSLVEVNGGRSKGGNGSRCGWESNLPVARRHDNPKSRVRDRATCTVCFADISGGTERMYPGELRVLSHTVRNCRRSSRRHTRNHRTMPRKLLEDRRDRTLDEHRSTARQILDSQR